MKKQVSTAIALILALSAAPVMAQDASTGSSGGATESGDTSEPGSTETDTDSQASPAGDTDSTTTPAGGGADAPAAGTDATAPAAGTAPAAEAAPAAGAEAEASTSTEISTEQQTEIRTVVTEVNASPVEIDFDLDIGVAVPSTVTLQPLPARVIELVPAYEGYLFFVLADGRIVIVQPESLEVVYILAA
jgi:hypothetical protein